MLYTSFEKLAKAGTCHEEFCNGAEKVGGVFQYGRKTPISLLQILDAMGFDDAIWALRACDGAEKFSRTLARKYALRAMHLWYCPDIVRRWLETGDESIREEAQVAALDVADAAWATVDAARAAALATADAATWAAARAARAAADAARVAAWAAGWNEERAWQEATLREMLLEHQ